MGLLTVLNPLPVAAIGGTLVGAARLLTPDPREACARFPNSDTRTIDVDLGRARLIDTLFLGYVSSLTLAPVQVSYGLGGYSDAALAQPLSAAPGLGSPFQHYLLVLSAPVQARYLRLTLALGVGGSAGVLAIGRSFAAAHEWGGGRTIGDNTVVTRLLTGGVGVEPGARFGGYSWTFADLTDDELATLYQLARDRGVGRQLLVVEDAAATACLNERIHWCLFAKFEAYERKAFNLTKWALKVEDWL